MAMSCLEVGKKLVALCKDHKENEAMQSLYHTDIVSIEAGGPAGMPREMKGLAAVQGKAKWWQENHEVHSSKVEGPFPHEDRFAVRFTYDVTMKANKQRITMDEVALYTVKDGKVVKEEFFYVTG